LRVLRSKVVKETLLVVKNLGVQINSHRMDGSQSKKFIDISRVRDFIVNEYLTFFYVRQYCGFLVENED
jgi:hypothetical protein